MCNIKEILRFEWSYFSLKREIQSFDNEISRISNLPYKKENGVGMVFITRGNGEKWKSLSEMISPRFKDLNERVLQTVQQSCQRVIENEETRSSAQGRFLRTVRLVDDIERQKQRLQIRDPSFSLTCNYHIGYPYDPDCPSAVAVIARGSDRPYIQCKDSQDQKLIDGLLLDQASRSLLTQAAKPLD